MFRRTSDFLATWEQERTATLRLFRALDERSLAQAVAHEHRSLGRLAWHVTTTIAEMMERTGLVIGGPAHDAAVPGTAAAIVAAYEAASQRLAEQVAGWPDAALETEDEMYGERWARGRTLLALVAHQAHHRGQMTVLMRQAGLVVPGVYGPAREEWASFGMPAPEV
jgi:uncharacterized damage-inducible protein DinB